jgi:GAF domain-containing protein
MARMSGSNARALDDGWLRRPWEPPNDDEVLAANASAAGLYLAGAALCATGSLLPHLESLAGITAVGVVAVITAIGLLLAARARRGGLGLALTVELWGVFLIAVAVASTGGTSSPLAVMYLFAIGHAGAFQPRPRLALVVVATTVAFLAPLAYESATTTFAAVACIALVVAGLTLGLVHFTLNYVRGQRRLLGVLVAATSELGFSLDPVQTLLEFARALVPDIADVCWVDLRDPDRTMVDSVALAADPGIRAQLERIARAAPLRLIGQHPIAEALRSGSPWSAVATSDDEIERLARNDEHRELIARFGGEAVAIFPLLARGRTRGTISFIRLGPDARFPPDVLDLLTDLSGRAAMAFDNARLYAERTRVAQTLRRSLMPSVLPSIPGLELVSFFRPLGAGSEVGGDFYDAFGESGRWWLIVGDVCGKGAEAAALTGFLRHTAAALTRDAIRPATVLSRVNQLMLAQDFEGRFATAALVRVRTLDTHAEVTLASAGHPPALIARADGRVEELGERGTLLGVFGDPIISESSAVLEMGDALALYTDGLLEAHAPEHVVTPAEIVELLGRLPSRRSARETLDALLGVVDLSDDVRDDIVVLVGHVTPRSGSEDGRAEGAAQSPLQLRE